MALRLFFIFSLLCTSAWAQKREGREQIERRLGQLTSFTEQKLSREHNAVSRWMQNRSGKMPRASERLLKAYYFIGSFHAQLYANHASGDEDRKDLSHYANAKKYLEICAAYEHEIDKTEQKLERLEQLKGIRAKKMTSFKWRFLFQYLSYQELALLKDSGGEEKIYSPQRGFCVGGQMAWGSMTSEWALDACAYASGGNVGAENTARYFQKDVTSRGLYFKPTYWKLLSEGEAGLGIGVPVLLRTVDYTEPSGVTVKSRRAIPFGVSIDGRWRLSESTYFTATSAMVDGSLLWTLGGMYQL